MFDRDERGASGWTIAATALARGRAGGTLVLNLPESWDGAQSKGNNPFAVIRRARDEQGWNVHRVTSWDELVAFARAFSAQKFGGAA
jgi:hypothetical protein